MDFTNNELYLIERTMDNLCAEHLKGIMQYIHTIEHLEGDMKKEGQIILDCFMGSGTVAIASRKLNRKFIGCDTDDTYIDLINNRLSQKLLNDDGGTNFTKSSADDFPYQESLISVDLIAINSGAYKDEIWNTKD